MKNLTLLPLVAVVLPAAGFADVPGAFSAKDTEVAVDYTYVRANAPPGECGCFSMNGGSISVAHALQSDRYSAVFDATLEHASAISAGRYGLTLSIATLGLQYRPWRGSQWSPFGHVLLGVSHASGSLVEGDTPAAHDASLGFASNVGGGIDYRIDERWSIRVLEADYLLTTYSNRSNDHQNNLRIGVGAAFRFGAP